MSKIGSGMGNVTVEKEHTGATADVFVCTGEEDYVGASLSKLDVWDLIVALAETAGFQSEATAAGTGLIIQRPESPAVQERREELAVKFFCKPFSSLDSQNSVDIIDFIVEGEIKRGELR